MCLAPTHSIIPYALMPSPLQWQMKANQSINRLRLLSPILSPATALGSRARGLERELKGIGATHETHSSEELYSDSPKTASPGALSQAKTIAFCDSNNIMCEHANLAGCE